MTPNSDMSGIIMFHYKECAITDKYVFRVEYPTINNPTVEQIYNMLATPDKKNIRLDRYRFSPQGNGCAFWGYIFLLKIEEAGYLATGTGNKVWGHMQDFYINGVSQGPVVADGERKGTFY
jgi:hypothetical protein